MYRQRHLILALILALIVSFPVRGSADNDSPAGPEESLPSRIPLLDESELNKYSTPKAGKHSGAVVDEEFPPGAHIPLDTSNLRYFSYFAKINHQIDQAYYYPRSAAKDILNGLVTVLIEIERDGGIGELKVIESSGHDILDDTAIEIVRKASPFPTVPARIHSVPLKVVRNIRFIPTQEAIQRQEGIGLAVPFD